MYSHHHTSTKTIVLKIASINTSGINNNIEYLNSLALTHDIVCIQETWSTKQHEIETIIYQLNKKIYINPAKRTEKKGRPSGGLAFIVDKNMDCKFKIHSNRIASIKVMDTLIVNVYLPHFTGELDQNQEFDLETSILSEIISTNKNLNVLIIGDFNTDIIKYNHNTNSIMNLLQEHEPTISDIVQYQEVDFTYRKIRENKCITSWIDHVICKKDFINKIKTRIMCSDYNLSEHNAISTTIINTIENNKINEKKMRTSKVRIDWSKLENQKRYQEILENQMKSLDNLIENISKYKSKFELKIKLCEALNGISSYMIRSVKKVKEESCRQSKKKKKKLEA